MTDTPSPQSVVVPDPLWMMHVIGPDDIYPAPDHATAVQWCAYLNSEIAPKVPSVLCVAVPAIWTGTAEEHADGLAEAIKGWAVPTAPAPSSLAGGEVERAARALLDACIADFGDPADYPDDDGWVASGDNGDSAVTFKHLRDLQAALSPEAPARDTLPEDDELPGDFLARVGMDGALWATEFRKMALKLGHSDMDEGWLIGWFCNAVMAGYDHAQRRYDPALTPRHEAPAEGAGEAENPGGYLIKDFADNWFWTPHRIAAVAALTDGHAVYDLRVRSPAPEAREEALGNLLAVIHGDGGHRALEVGTKQAALEAEKIVARLLSSAPEAREREAWPERWSGPCTVGNMISNLRTLPPEMPLYSAYHIPRDDQPSLLKVKRPTLSRERVDGTNIKTGDESIPYSAVIWSQPRDPEEAHPAAPSAHKLREFGQHTNLELSYHYSEERDNDGWQVHQVNGGVNDREWTLMGSGDTPADAIDQALAALKAEGKS